MKIRKHFDYLTPFSEAANDKELEEIMRLKYPKACSNLEVDAGFFAEMVAGVQKYRAWQVIGFGSFEDFCRDELGKTLAEVEAIVAGVKVLQSRGVEKPTLAEVMGTPPCQKHGGDRRSEERNQGSDSTLKGRRDNSYLAARLNRDHPEIAARVKAGEFRSVRAAAIAAGIVRVPTALEVTKKAFAKMSARERQQFRSWLEGQ